jgi:uncharacterized protein (TIGR02444 family)
MVALYGVAGIGPLCLGLQDRYGADVPLLLFLAIADEAGHGLDAAGEQAVVAAAAAWRRASVTPLRALRVALKDLCVTPDELMFRASVKAVELEAERLQVARIAAAFVTAADGTITGGAGAGGLAARRLAALGVPAHEADAALQVIRAGLASLPPRASPDPHDPSSEPQKDPRTSWPTSTA